MCATAQPNPTPILPILEKLPDGLDCRLPSAVLGAGELALDVFVDFT